MEKNLLIIGAGGHGKVVAEAAGTMGKWQEILFLDDNKKLGSKVSNIQIIGSLKDLLDDYFCQEQYDIAVGIGSNDIRKKIIECCVKLKFNLPIIIHNTAYISPSVKIGLGSVILAKSVINTDSIVGKGCIINTAATIGHDCILENYVQISSGVNLAGATCVKENSWIGIGACTRQQICIGANSIVGAGAVVIDNVDANAVVVGNPAKLLIK